MRVVKRLTALEMATKLCRFIPELEPGAVLCCLEQSGDTSFEPSSFHRWLEYFDSLVIDGKEFSHEDVLG